MSHSKLFPKVGSPELCIHINIAFRECGWVCVDSAEERIFGEDLRFVRLAAINNGVVMVEEVTAVAKEEKIFNSLLKVKRAVLCNFWVETS